MDEDKNHTPLSKSDAWSPDSAEALGERMPSNTGRSRELKVKGKNYRGRAVSTDTIEASAKAYLNAINKVAIKHRRKKHAYLEQNT